MGIRGRCTTGGGGCSTIPESGRSIGEMDDNLVTTDKVYILSRFLGDNSYYWGMVVTRDATLGFIRMLMNEYAPQLWDAIPH